MAANYVDYEVLEQAIQVYTREAGTISETISNLDQMTNTLAEGWQNQTSNAFIERYETEYKNALEKMRDSLSEIADYIKRYRENVIENDVNGANAIS
ncbi:WXG100 family type VII secretion target [Clostridium sp. OM07-10AC]|nr:WXG100 family type VII secretion target [Clostridium sp. OM07-9AC]RHU99337.1 WXG100 family type VII secretion target [Clostridium sp. OM07-10AC]